MFTEDGDLFYPAFPGDPAYEGFITDEYVVQRRICRLQLLIIHKSEILHMFSAVNLIRNASLPVDKFPGGGPTALAEFFGDFMVVNGKIWPKANVEPREYRLRLLNACDSRFLVIQFVAVEINSISPHGAEALYYTIVGSDGGLGTPRHTSSPLVMEPGARYDIVIDFGQAQGKRVILKNLASDTPFGGSFGDANAAEDSFADRLTDRIMAFDVDNSVAATPVLQIGSFPSYMGVDQSLVSNSRHVALFEGLDEFGRLQPLLGARDTIYNERGLFPAYSWSQPTTEVIELGATEEWYIYNFSADGTQLSMYKLF